MLFIKAKDLVDNGFVDFNDDKYSVLELHDLPEENEVLLEVRLWLEWKLEEDIMRIIPTLDFKYIESVVKFMTCKELVEWWKAFLQKGW